MAAKKTSELIPLCHPISITHVGVELELCDAPFASEDRAVAVGEDEKRASTPRQAAGLGDMCALNKDVEDSEQERQGGFGSVEITATVSCDGKTGVEMEALTAASVAALTVYDMCKAVDKGMRVEGLRVVRKEGGKSGVWIERVRGDEVDLNR